MKKALLYIQLVVLLLMSGCCTGSPGSHNEVDTGWQYATRDSLYPIYKNDKGDVYVWKKNALTGKIRKVRMVKVIRKAILEDEETQQEATNWEYKESPDDFYPVYKDKNGKYYIRKEDAETGKTIKQYLSEDALKSIVSEEEK